MNPIRNSAVQETYTAEQVATILGISIRKAYYLCNTTKDFKVIRIGKNLRIHKGSFDKWFNGSTEDSYINERSD